MEPQKDRFFIFKFGIHISRVSIAANFQTDVRVSWHTDISKAEGPLAVGLLRNGEAQLDADLVMEDILRQDIVTLQFRPREVLLVVIQSILVVEFTSNGQVQRAGICRVNLAELATNSVISTCRIHTDNVNSYQLTECFGEDAQISFGLTHISSFEIDETEVLSFAALSRQGSQRLITEADSELPPVFGMRQPQQQQFGSVQQPEYSDPTHGNSQQAQNKPRVVSKSASRPALKSPSPGGRSNTGRHADEYEKFMRIIESKDELIHELQIKIEGLLQSKKVLQMKCSTLEQQLKSVQLDYKAVIATRDRNTPMSSNNDVVRFFPASKSKERTKSRDLEPEHLPEAEPKHHYPLHIQRKRSEKAIEPARVGIQREAPKEDAKVGNLEFGSSSNLHQSKEIKPASKSRDQKVVESDQRLKDQILELETQVKFLKNDLARKDDNDSKQKSLIEHLTDKLMAKASEPAAASVHAGDFDMQKSLILHLQEFQKSQREELEAMKQNQQQFQEPSLSLKEVDKIRKEYDEQLKEMRDVLFGEKKKNILLEEENTRFKANIRRMEDELRAAVSSNKRSAHSRNEELQLQEHYIEQKNKELRNELQELKKSALSVDRNGNSGSKAYNLSEERYKVLEEELKLKISTLREELDQKQLEFKSLIHEKQVEINSMKDQLHVSTNLKASLEKKLESLTQAIANEKEKVLINEKKAMNYDRLEKRLVELEKFNTEVKQDYEKVQGQKRVKISEINELKLRLQEREIEWTRLKRLEGDYKNLQEMHLKLTQIKQKNDRRLEEMERKTLKLRETLLLNGSKGGMLEERLMREIEEKIKEKGKSEDVILLENERKQLKEQSEKLNSKVKELQQEIIKGRETQSQVLQLEEEKSKLKKQLSIDIETKLRAVETRLETKRSAELNELAVMGKSRDVFQQTRMKMLERENEEIRSLTKELTRKLLDMERLNIERTDHSEVQYNLKKRERDFRDTEENFEREIQDMMEADLSMSMASQLDDRQRSENSQVLEKKEQQKQRKDRTKAHLERLRRAYLKRIDFLKGELMEYQKKQVTIFEKEKELEIRETRMNAAEQSKKLLKLYEAHNLEIKYLKEKAERLEQIEPEYLELKEKAEKFDAMRASLMNKKTEQEENIKAELQKRNEENRNKIHKLTIDLQELKFQKDVEKTELDSQVKDLKKSLADSREGFEKLKKVSRQEIAALSDQVKRQEEEMTAFRQTYQSNTTMLVDEVEKRDATIKYQTSEIEYLTGKLDEAIKLYHSNLSINAEQQNIIKVTSEQNAELREIVLFRQQENADLMSDLDNLQRELQIVMQEQQAKYEELDSINKDQISLLHQEVTRLQKVLEEEMDKALHQEEQVTFLKSEIQKYEGSIEELYTEALNNEEAMKNLREAEEEHLEQKRIVEEEYEKLLHQFGEKTIEVKQLKNEYITLQGLYTTSEMFIKKQEDRIEQERKHYEEVFREMEGQRQRLVTQLEELKATAELKEQEFLNYNKNMSEREKQYQVCIEEFKFDLEKQRIALDEARHTGYEIEEENTKLREELQVLRQFKKDNEKRKGKRGAEPQLREDKSMRKLTRERDQPERSPMMKRDEFSKAQLVKSQNILLMPPQETSRGHSPTPSHRTESHRSDSLPKDDSRFEPPPTPAIRVLTVSPEDDQMESPNYDFNARRTFKEQDEEENTEQHQQEGHQQYSEPVQRRYSPQIAPQKEELHMIEERNLLPVMVDSQIREETHDSGDESEKDSYHELSNQLKSAELRIGEYQKELSMKNSAMQELEIDNNRLREVLQQKISKRTRIGPDGKIYQGQPDELDEEDAKLLEQMNTLKDEIKELKIEVEHLRDDNQRYIDSIKDIHEQYELLSQQKDELNELYKEKKKQLQAAQEKELEYLEDQRAAGELIDQKETLIAEFQEMLKSYQIDKENAEKMMLELQREYDEKLIVEKQLRSEIKDLEEELKGTTETVAELQANQSELEGKLEAVTCEYTSCRSTKAVELSTLHNELLSVKSEVKHKEINLNDLAQKYVDLEDGLSKWQVECKKLELRLQEKNQKYEQALLKISSLEKDLNLGVLLRKDLESRVADVLKENKSKEAERSRLNNQLLADLKRMEQQKESLYKKISNLDSSLEQKELDCYALKKDIELFNMENKKLQRESEELTRTIRLYEQQTKQVIVQYEQELQSSRSQEKGLDDKIRELEEIILQHEQSAEELQKIDRIRQDMVHEMERKYQLLEEEHNNQQEKLTAEFNARLTAAIRELSDKYNQQANRQTEELKFLKNMCDQMKFEMEQERANMFDRECQQEQEKHNFMEERSQFQDKIRRYEHELKDIVDKFRQIEKERPTVELYEQLAFQNEIFKSRIAELQRGANFKQQVDQNELLEEFEYFKAQKQREREEFLAELDNYSGQVNELEQKNYLLNKELESIKCMDFGRMRELEEENMQLQKEVIRLEHTQQELTNELRVLKHKREEDLKRHYSEVRLLKQK